MPTSCFLYSNQYTAIHCIRPYFENILKTVFVVSEKGDK